MRKKGESSQSVRWAGLFLYLRGERQGLPQSHTRARPVSTPQVMPVMHCTRLRTSRGPSEGVLVALDVLRCYWYANYGLEKVLSVANKALLVVWSSMPCNRFDCHALERVVVLQMPFSRSPAPILTSLPSSLLASIEGVDWLVQALRVVRRQQRILPHS